MFFHGYNEFLNDNLQHPHVVPHSVVWMRGGFRSCVCFFSFRWSLFLSLSESLCFSKNIQFVPFYLYNNFEVLFFFSFNDYICCSSRQIIKTLISFYSSVTVLLNLQTIKYDCTPYADQLVTWPVLAFGFTTHKQTNKKYQLVQSQPMAYKKM